MAKRQYLEEAFQEQVIKYLKLQYPHLLFFSVPNGGKRNAWEAGRLKKQGVLAGVSDILLFWQGGHGAIELKQGKNKTTPQQDYFGDKWEWADGKYAVCYNLDQVIAAFKEWGIK